ncbi:transmembrane protein, putative [Bodo saltans]|uniref:Transmembrane protein, putative n=1 Tax=Bodo saltans TaxID=75058 RepID=A0A0S4ITA4_BODSA|nr:transmembrane protein, putative [Bodo saltans]|eukprot:CUE74193.1 transmembrane protein, putative [Bodo saltans]
MVSNVIGNGKAYCKVNIFFVLRISRFLSFVRVKCYFFILFLSLDIGLRAMRPIMFDRALPLKLTAQESLGPVLYALALLCYASCCCFVAADMSVLSTSSCVATSSVNITSGVTAGVRKFMVSASDCCNYCATLPACTAAVFSSYYCAPYATVESTGPASTCTTLTVATTSTTTTTTQAPTTTTTMAPPTTTTTTAAPITPVPFTPVPQRGSAPFAFLVTCPGALTCGVSIYSCISIVLPLNTCAFDASNGRYLLAQNFSNDITVTEYSSDGCEHGTVLKRANFPSECTYNNEGNSVLGFVETIDEGQQNDAYDVTQENFFESVCASNGAQTFSTTSGTCIEATPQTPAPGSGGSSSSSAQSSSSSATASSGGFEPLNPLVGAAQKVFCVGDTSIMGMVIFAYPTLSACNANMPVVGVSMLANTCFTTMLNSGEIYTFDSCTKK